MRWIAAIALLVAVGHAGDEEERSRVIDLATDKPAAGLELVLESNGHERAVQTDAEGRFRRPGLPQLTIRAKDEAWHVRETKADGFVAYRMVPIVGKFVHPDGRAFDGVPGVDVTYSLAHDPSKERNLGSGILRMRSLGLEPIGTLTKLEAGGVVRGTVPAIRGLVVRADGINVFAPAQAVDFRQGATVRLLTYRSLLVRGFVRDDAGAPVAGARIRGYLVLEGPPDYVTVGLLKARGRRQGGFGLGKGAHWARGHLTVSARSADDGRFELDCPTDGRLRIVVAHAGYELVDGPVRWLDKPIDRLSLKLTRTRKAASIQLRTARGPVAGGAGASLIQFHPNGDQIPLSLRLDPAGGISTEWLKRGGRYRIGASKHGSTWFTWNGQKKLELKPGHTAAPDGFLKPLKPPGG